MSEQTEKIKYWPFYKCNIHCRSTFFTPTKVYQNLYKYLYSLLKRREQIENKSAALCNGSVWPLIKNAIVIKKLTFEGLLLR
jgi:hypothetical protein